MMKTNGLFVAFEGLDGCGKSTQIKNVEDYIKKEYDYIFNGVDIGCEPTNKESGKFIRKVLSGEVVVNDLDVMIGMFIADRANHQEDIIESIDMLNNAYICDRYIYSNIAYNAESYEYFDFIDSLNSSFLKPDLYFCIDTNVDTCIERIKRRSHKDIFENSEFLLGVKQRYDILCSQGKLIRINGNQSEYEVFQDIKYHIDNYIKNHYNTQW